MNITDRTPDPQTVHPRAVLASVRTPGLRPALGTASRILVLIALTVVAGCGGKKAAGGASPSSPETAVRAFLKAVKANDLVAMRELWGSEKGPTASYRPAAEVEQRLTVIRTFLEHESFEFDAPNSVDPANSAQRLVKVRLLRKGCKPVVPFTTVPWNNGWLVKDIALAEAGNPARSCQAEPAPGT